MVNDRIADLLTRLRNGTAVNKQIIALPHTRVNSQIVNILETEGFLDFLAVSHFNNTIFVAPRYRKNTPHLTGLRRISKPGCRVYVNHKEIPKVLGGMGIAIISTANGIITDRAARQLRVGGEVLCYIW